jgi:hypothetical protein
LSRSERRGTYPRGRRSSYRTLTSRESTIVVLAWYRLSTIIRDVKPRYIVPQYNVLLHRYNVENILPLPIGAHMNQPQYNINFNVKLIIFSSWCKK